MHLEYTPEQQKLRAKIRGQLESVMTPERIAAVSRRNEGGPAVKECVRALAAAGLLGLGWPKHFGGQGLSAIEQHIFFEEAKQVSAPIPLVTLNTVGPTLMQFGTEEQKQRFLPAILNGEVEFAIGYSEPSAGSDLASLRTAAVRDGDEWVINGQKMYTSGAGTADWIWLAARTDPDAKPHKGISLFIVSTSAPGFSHTPLHTMTGISTYNTFYDDVRVPASALVGAENEGWKLITTQLNFERASLGSVGALEPLFDKTLRWATDTEVDGAKVIDQPWVQLALARAEAQIAAYKLVNLRVNAAMTKKALEMGEASAAKVFGTELTQQVAGGLMEILDRNGCRSGRDAPLRGELESAVRLAVLNTFGGGANETQRTIIAMAGLGMPREPPPEPAIGGAIDMDFTFTEDQRALGKIARDLFERRLSPERLTAIENTQTRHDPDLWKDLADADLLGVALPESVGGSGRGFLELGMLLAEVGWSVAPVPAYPTLVLGADTIVRYGSAEQHQRHLPGVIAGERILTAGLTEPGRSDITAPTTTARRDQTGWRLHGVKELVPAGQIADMLLISATTEDGDVGLFGLDAHAAGVRIEPVATTGGQPHADVTLDGAAVAAEDRFGAPSDGAAMLQAIHDRALVGLCAMQLGVTERALRMAAAYTSERVQFNRPIGSFQAVQQRMADAFIDVEAIRWTTWHAAWLLGEGRSATREAHIAKFWAAEAGMRVAATAQQVHGGVGIDLTYPLFRYFLWAKHNELAMGPATAQLARLGSTYAAARG